MTLHVSLPPQLEELVRRRVESGRYGSASEVVREALRLLDEREQHRDTRLTELRQSIRQGLDDVAKGRTRELDVESFLDQCRREDDSPQPT
jgi:antitoxin ParD1/3/4